MERQAVRVDLTPYASHILRSDQAGVCFVARRCTIIGEYVCVEAKDSVLRVNNSIVRATNCLVVGSGNAVRGKHNWLVGDRNVTDDVRSTIDTVTAHPTRNVVCWGWENESISNGVWRDVTELNIDDVVACRELTRRFVFCDATAPIDPAQVLFSSDEYKTTKPTGHLVPMPPPQLSSVRFKKVDLKES